MLNKNSEYEVFFSKRESIEKTIIKLFQKYFAIQFTNKEIATILSPWIDLAINQYFHRIFYKKENKKLNRHPEINIDLNDLNFLERAKTTEFQEEIDNIYFLSKSLISKKIANVNFVHNDKTHIKHRIFGTIYILVMFLQKNLINFISIFINVSLFKIDFHSRYNFNFKDKLKYLINNKILLISLRNYRYIPAAFFFKIV